MSKSNLIMTVFGTSYPCRQWTFVQANVLKRWKMWNKCISGKHCVQNSPVRMVLLSFQNIGKLLIEFWDHQILKKVYFTVFPGMPCVTDTTSLIQREKTLPGNKQLYEAYWRQANLHSFEVSYSFYPKSIASALGFNTEWNISSPNLS